jgi:hypothetical protein
VFPGTSAFFRVPPAAAACQCADSDRAYVKLYLDLSYNSTSLVLANSPWKVLPLGSSDDPCSMTATTQCTRLTGASLSPAVLVVSDDPTAPAHNVEVRLVDSTTNCP